MKNYRELNVWKQGIELVKMTFALSKNLPSEEKFGIISQMTRAAVSIPANIAEGSGRKSDRDYARFLQISLRSAFELQTYLVIVKELEWIKKERSVDFDQLLEQEIKMLHSFIKMLSAKSQ